MTTAGTIRTALIALAILLLTLTPSMAQETRPVDVVVMLDTSGSMENLLDATRARVWDVVNELGRMKPTPELRVGLISFGTDKATADQGFIIQHVDLTYELDEVYAELMELTTGGGDELVGRALNEALDGMNWSPEHDALRVVFVAGNESADQGVEDDDFRIAARAARDRDIIINALYAGNREQGVVEKWHEIAQAGEGNFSAIDPSTGSIQIAAPQDTLLLELNGRLNTTYVPYGEKGQDGLTNQIAQDSNASRLGVQSCSSRIVAKGGALYNNASWDLVDKSLEDGFNWDAISPADLPEEMQSMTMDEMIEFIDAKRALREGIQTEIQSLSDARETFVRQAIATRIGEAGLGEAMRNAIREQAMAKGFNCDGC
ncbi:MAG: VWA domain-containing protein [Acidobacteriota bacterium]|nr:VWA domain-containing protein [Acidobacteriota bacterium]MDH3784462.1 VWA domain-containing protein [Acidobacteriota bacterium]